jgi:hypothetical protein
MAPEPKTRDTIASLLPEEKKEEMRLSRNPHGKTAGARAMKIDIFSERSGVAADRAANACVVP